MRTANPLRVRGRAAALPMALVIGLALGLTGCTDATSTTTGVASSPASSDAAAASAEPSAEPSPEDDPGLPRGDVAEVDVVRGTALHRPDGSTLDLELDPQQGVTAVTRHRDRLYVTGGPGSRAPRA